VSPRYPDLRRRRSRRWAEPSFAAGARTLPLLRPRPCRTPLSAVGLTGGGRPDGGGRGHRETEAWLGALRCRRPADEKGRPLSTRMLELDAPADPPTPHQQSEASQDAAPLARAIPVPAGRRRPSEQRPAAVAAEDVRYGLLRTKRMRTSPTELRLINLLRRWCISSSGTGVPSGFARRPRRRRTPRPAPLLHLPVERPQASTRPARRSHALRRMAWRSWGRYTWASSSPTVLVRVPVEIADLEPRGEQPPLPHRPQLFGHFRALRLILWTI
jgi:hypothetical protein